VTQNGKEGVNVGDHKEVGGPALWSDDNLDIVKKLVRGSSVRVATENISSTSGRRFPNV